MSVHEQIEAARARGDGVALARLRFRLPVSQRERHSRISTTDEAPQLVSRSEYRQERGSSRNLRTDPRHQPRVILGKKVAEGLRSARYGKEDAGWLVGPYQSADAVVEAHRAMWPAFQHDRGPNSVRVQFGEIDQLNAGLYPEARVVGHWHSQPSSCEPSEADVELWRAARDHLDGLPFIALVMQERLNPRSALVARAFVFDRLGYKPAHISWRDF